VSWADVQEKIRLLAALQQGIVSADQGVVSTPTLK